MTKLLRFLFFLLIVRPLVLVIIGLNVRRRSLLPAQGPAVVIANHNSHLDTLVLISLFPLCLLPKLRPVAAMDYFLRNRWLAWFALNIIGIIPLRRGVKASHDDPLAEVVVALDNDDILILFPEGSRGETERVGRFKTGIAHIAQRRPEVPMVPMVPVYLHGLGMALPKGDFVLVPFFCDVFVGEALHWQGDRKAFMNGVTECMTALSGEGRFPAWE
ncbi:MAG: 1-acyl-sn-glycerol-3-phosphate acyltransferase [Candidatus Thiodiazotropha sp. (ex Ustalcina ferruginea)]|nr:1-acyl-sn-glycerol-3-phosphate acyltransferase [Candidatus Thiodiazotropha sp. (ex Ustalcina ferruginea)]